MVLIKHWITFDRRKYRHKIDAMVDDLNNPFNYLVDVKNYVGLSSAPSWPLFMKLNESVNCYTSIF